MDADSSSGALGQKYWEDKILRIGLIKPLFTRQGRQTNQSEEDIWGMDGEGGTTCQGNQRNVGTEGPST